MKLIGCEVRNYVGFERQFVPIGNPLHILAGKNNCGKTALLHALGALTSNEHQSYGGNQSSVRYCLHIQSQGELDLLYNHQSVPLATQDYVLVFEVAGPPQRPELVAAELVLNTGEKFPAIERTSGHVVKHKYRVLDRGAVVPLDDQYAGASEFWALTAQLEPLRAVSYVNPHRQIQHGMTAPEVTELPVNGRTLAPFLQTVQNADHERFRALEQAFLKCFPEFSKITIPLTGSTVDVVFVEKATGRRVSIHQCGTGVEQMLVLIACVLGARDPRLFLLDDPQDFLHPFLERHLMDILTASNHSFVIATHSATIINSVDANHVTYIEKPGKPYEQYVNGSTESIRVLRELGYRNSDLLFFDGILFVEGISDKELLPKLFELAAPGEWRRFRDIGISDLGGTAEYRDFDDLEIDLIRQEKIIAALHRTRLPHVYVFDGDKKYASARLQEMRPSGGELHFDFLKRSEVENYLIDASAICTALNEEMKERGLERTVSIEEVNKKLGALLPYDRATKLYKRQPPSGMELQQVQGSRLLAALYGEFKLRYDKRRTGARILQHLSLQDDQRQELTALLSRLRDRLLF